jgi:cytochrome c peroxidase
LFVMKKMNIALSLVAVSVVTIISCNKELNHSGLQALTPNMTLLGGNYQSKNMMVNNAKADLGRVLFYDRALSANNAVSCGSCHAQSHGFAEARKVSTGFSNEVTNRNSIAIQNLGFGFDSATLIFNPNMSASVQHLFWDGRSKSVEDLMLRPIANHIEMGQDVALLAGKLNKLPYYKTLVQKAFSKEELDLEIIVHALTHFVASIRTNDSPVDDLTKVGNPNNLSPLALQGQSLFTSEQYNCISCHTSVFAGNIIEFGGSVYGGNDSNSNFAANIGLQGEDKGLGERTGKLSDMGSFKIPDLHNVALTSPYMHDGRFETLDEVLDHYSHGVANNAALDVRLKNPDGSAKVMNIPASDKQAIIAFLNALTSKKSLTEPLYADPFKK